MKTKFTISAIFVVFLVNIIEAQVTPNAYYPFNANANDASGNGYNGTVNGATLTQDLNGNDNSAYAFSYNSFISLPNLGVSPSPFTISMLIKLQYQSPSTILNFSDATNQNFFKLMIAGSDLVLSESNYSSAVSATGCPTNKWIHLVLIAGASGGYGNSGIMAIYINGTKIISTIATASPSTMLPFLVMFTKNYIGNDFTGAIDEIKIFNQSLTDAQISQLYANLFVGHISYGYDLAGNRISRIIQFPVTKSVSNIPGKIVPLDQFEEKLGENAIRIYPNPTQGNLTIEISGNNADVTTTIGLYNLSGNLLISKTTTGSSIPLDLTGYPVGTYVLKIKLNGQVSDWKIVKE